jgi:hypothetical protein
VIVWLGCLACLALAGCGASAGGEDGPPPAYATQFSDAVANAKSDFVRGILEDGVIEEPEFDEAKDRVLECVKAAKIRASYRTDQFGNDVYETIGNVSDSQAGMQTECFEQWMGDVAWLHEALRVNPLNEDLDAIIAECLVRNELAAPGFTGEDYKEFTSQFSMEVDTSTLDPKHFDISIDPADLPSVAPTLPGGVSNDDPRVTACVANPKGQG